MFKEGLENALLLLGGIALFLSGLKGMSANVQSLAGKRMKTLLGRFTGNRLYGALTGCAVTAVIQSSTASNIMLVGFVSAGAMSLGQAVPVVMGANIGTTVTAQLVALSGEGAFSVTAIAAFIGFLGFLTGLIKNPRAERVGGIMLGFGCVFIGLEVMNGAVIAFKEFAFFRRLFAVQNPFALMLNGFLITAVVQSSSAVSSVMIVLAMNGLISFEGSMYLILGTNIGAGVAVLLVGATSSREAVQVAVANILFNVMGALLFLPFIVAFEDAIGSFFLSFSGSIERQVANFHTVFNLLSTALMLPFTRPFETLVVKICSLFESKRKSAPAKA